MDLKHRRRCWTIVTVRNRLLHSTQLVHWVILIHPLGGSRYQSQTFGIVHGIRVLHKWMAKHAERGLAKPTRPGFEFRIVRRFDWDRHTFRIFSKQRKACMKGFLAFFSIELISLIYCYHLFITPVTQVEQPGNSCWLKVNKGEKIHGKQFIKEFNKLVSLIIQIIYLIIWFRWTTNNQSLGSKYYYWFH